VALPWRYANSWAISLRHSNEVEFAYPLQHEKYRGCVPGVRDQMGPAGSYRISLPALISTIQDGRRPWRGVRQYARRHPCATPGAAGRVVRSAARQGWRFFRSVPSGGDAYILSHILHDWHDDQCLTILGHCRKAMKSDGRLLIVEMVLPPGDTPHPGKILDMVILVLIGGQERTEAEYSRLLDKAGFRLVRVVATQSPVSVVEAVLA
jgi:hypothetical protein